MQIIRFVETFLIFAAIISTSRMFFCFIFNPQIFRNLLEIRRFLGGLQERICQVESSFASLRPVIGDHCVVRAVLFRLLDDHVEFSVGVGGELVHRHDYWDAEVRDVLDLKS